MRPPAGATPSGAGRMLARTAALAVLVLALPIVGGAAVLHGTEGAAGASAGLALVFVLFGVAALLHGRGARLSPQAWAALAAAGFGGRLLLYTVALTALSRVDALHWPSLALATAFGIAGTLAAELWILTKRSELFWVRTARMTEGADR